MQHYAYLTGFAILLSFGQILFKKAAMTGQGRGFLESFTNGWMIVALLSYIAATVLWIWILRTVPLSVAYPFAALAFILVPVAALFFFGEPLNWRHAMGGVLIVAGILIVSSS